MQTKCNGTDAWLIFFYNFNNLPKFNLIKVPKHRFCIHIVIAEQYLRATLSVITLTLQRKHNQHSTYPSCKCSNHQSANILGHGTQNQSNYTDQQWENTLKLGELHCCHSRVKPYTCLHQLHLVFPLNTVPNFLEIISVLKKSACVY